MAWRALCIAGRFLTRLPFPDPGEVTPDAVGRSVPWYPGIGLLLGLLLSLLLALLLACCWPQTQGAQATLIAALLLACWVWVTGGLHLDGLADSADAWVGGIASRERTLEILKDPRCGPAGVTAIALTLLLKWSALASLVTAATSAPLASSAAAASAAASASGIPSASGLASASSISGASAVMDTSGVLGASAVLTLGLLTAIPMLARAQLLPLLATTHYARPQGMATHQTDHLPHRAAWLATALAGLASLALLGTLALPLLAAAIALFYLARRAMLRRLGGFTGDTAGALVELTETLLLLTAALLHSG